MEDQNKGSLQLTDDQKKEVMIVMRQAECYDVRKAAHAYFECGQNVLQAVCRLMEVAESSREEAPRDAEQQHFDEMRTILKSKYDLYYELTKASSVKCDASQSQEDSSRD